MGSLKHICLKNETLNQIAFSHEQLYLWSKEILNTINILNENELERLIYVSIENKNLHLHLTDYKIVLSTYINDIDHTLSFIFTHNSIGYTLKINEKETESKTLVAYEHDFKNNIVINPHVIIPQLIKNKLCVEF